MAYKSKQKFLERDGKTMSYCHVDPKLGKPCQAHIHIADLDIAKVDAKLLRQLGEELIAIADTAENQTSFVTPEQMIKKLGLGKAKPKTPAEANAWLEANSTPASIIPNKDSKGRWLEPNPSFGPPKCSGCGKFLEQRYLNTGQKIWHHTGHTELDSYYNIVTQPYNHQALVSNHFDELEQDDIDIITANVNIGNDYLDYNEYSYAPITAGREWGTPEAETAHGTYPAQCCSKCGSQDLGPYKPTIGEHILGYKKTDLIYIKCNYCGNKSDLKNR